MAIYSIVELDSSDLKRELIAADRDYFSDAACEAICEYIEDMSTNENESAYTSGGGFDVVAICCDFTEESILDYAARNGIEREEIDEDEDGNIEYEDDDDFKERVLDEIDETVLYSDDENVLYPE